MSVMRSKDYWIGRAVEARHLAGKVRNRTVREQLLELARHYERMAVDDGSGVLKVLRLKPERIE